MRNWMALMILIAGSSLGLAQSSDQQPVKSSAASASTQSKTDPTKEADIRKLLDIVGVKASAAQTMREMTESVKPTLTKLLPPGEYRAKLVDLFFTEFLSRADPQQVVNMAVPVYDKSFTHDEIKGLIRFYETPLGKKSASVLPRLTIELSESGRKWGEELGRQTMQDVLAQHPDLAQALETAQRSAPRQ
jgi:uncharacterized protein